MSVDLHIRRKASFQPHTVHAYINKKITSSSLPPTDDPDAHSLLCVWKNSIRRGECHKSNKRGETLLSRALRYSRHEPFGCGRATAPFRMYLHIYRIYTTTKSQLLMATVAAATDSRTMTTGSAWLLSPLFASVSCKFSYCMQNFLYI